MPRKERGAGRRERERKDTRRKERGRERRKKQGRESERERERDRESEREREREQEQRRDEEFHFVDFVSFILCYMCLDFEERRRTSAEGGEKSFFLSSHHHSFSHCSSPSARSCHTSFVVPAPVVPCPRPPAPLPRDSTLPRPPKSSRSSGGRVMPGGRGSSGLRAFG